MPPEWIDATPLAGRYEHSDYGEADFSPDALAAMIKHYPEFDQDLPFRDKHGSDHLWGKILDVRLQNDRLQVKLKWTPPGIKAWEDEQILHVSPEIAPMVEVPGEDGKLKQFGPVLVGLAGADTPFFKRSLLPAPADQTEGLLHDANFPDGVVSGPTVAFGSTTKTQDFESALAAFVRQRLSAMDIPETDLWQLVEKQTTNLRQLVEVILTGAAVDPSEQDLAVLAGALGVESAALRGLIQENLTMDKKPDTQQLAADQAEELKSLQAFKAKVDAERKQEKQTYEQKYAELAHKFEVQAFRANLTEMTRNEGREKLSNASREACLTFAAENPGAPLDALAALIAQLAWAPVGQQSYQGKDEGKRSEQPEEDNTAEVKQSFEDEAKRLNGDLIAALETLSDEDYVALEKEAANHG